MNKLGIVIILLVLVGGVLLYTNNQNQTTTKDSQNNVMSDEQKPSNDNMMDTDDTMMEDNNNDSSMMDKGEVKEFRVVGTNYAFSETEIRVNKGDTVRIVFVNEGGFHDWVIDEFNAATQQIQEGSQETIEFVADQTGTFEYYCSVGQHRAMGMVGNLIVE